jgi:hypothetical protein
MKKLVMAGFLLAGIFGANAQTIRAVAAGSVTTSTTGGNSSVNIGVNAGNTNAGNTGSANVFIGANSGPSVTTGGGNSFLGSSSGSANTTGSENVYLGVNSGYLNTAGIRNNFVGVNAGFNNTASYNNFFGYMSGFSNTTGTANSFFGSQAGGANTTGSQNIFMGSASGNANTIGGDNTFVGWAVGPANTTGNYNSFFGRSAGTGNTTGTTNTIIGALAGQFNTTGSGNVFLGFTAGSAETGSNKLYISNSSTASPLIWGDFGTTQLKLQGKVGIGGNGTTGFGSIPTTAGSVNVSAYNLFVKGGILTDEVRVALNSTWADYVFASDYNLKPLSEVEAFITKNKHLPNVPSAAQVKEDGINVADMAKIQQEKIEELTLYIIAQNKRIEALEAKMANK